MDFLDLKERLRALKKTESFFFYSRSHKFLNKEIQVFKVTCIINYFIVFFKTNLLTLR